MAKYYVLSALISVFIYAVASLDTVPVIIWSNDKPVEQYGSFGAVSAKQFDDDYLRQLTIEGRHLVVFLQDKLSIDDITQQGDVYSEDSDGGVFKNLKTMEETYNMFHLPYVTDPANSFEQLRNSFPGKVHDLVDNFDVENLDLGSKDNLIFVHLPPTGSSLNELRKSLERNDGIMGKLTKQLATRGEHFSAIYTAIKQTVKPVVSNLASGRHLLAQDDPKNSSFVNASSCIFFYARKVTLQLNKFDGKTVQTKSYELQPLTQYDESKTDCVKGIFVSKYSSSYPQGLQSFQFTMTFENLTTGYWFVNSIKITYEDKDGDSGTDQALVTNLPDTPQGYSYHCTEQPPFKVANSSQDEGAKYVPQLLIEGFQMQYMNLKSNKFGVPNDCEGFFSIGILSGLFVTLIMIVILAYGINMIAGINTMDRFDDPKGKTITVNVQDQ